MRALPKPSNYKLIVTTNLEAWGFHLQCRMPSMSSGLLYRLPKLSIQKGGRTTCSRTASVTPIFLHLYDVLYKPLLLYKAPHLLLSVLELLWLCASTLASDYSANFTVPTFYRPLLLWRTLSSSFEAVWISAMAIELEQPGYIHPKTLQSILFLLVYHLEVGSICFLQLLECSHLPRIICR
jgi:hypothetical protein